MGGDASEAVCCPVPMPRWSPIGEPFLRTLAAPCPRGQGPAANRATSNFQVLSQEKEGPRPRAGSQEPCPQLRRQGPSPWPRECCPLLGPQSRPSPPSLAPTLPGADTAPHVTEGEPGAQKWAGLAREHLLRGDQTWDPTPGPTSFHLLATLSASWVLPIYPWSGLCWRRQGAGWGEGWPEGLGLRVGDGQASRTEPGTLLLQARKAGGSREHRHVAGVLVARRAESVTHSLIPGKCVRLRRL